MVMTPIVISRKVTTAIIKMINGEDDNAALLPVMILWNETL